MSATHIQKRNGYNSGVKMVKTKKWDLSTSNVLEVINLATVKENRKCGYGGGLDHIYG